MTAAVVAALLELLLLQPSKADGQQGGGAEKPKGTCKRVFRHSRTNSCAAKKFLRAAAYDGEMPGVGLGVFAGNNLQGKGREGDAKGEAVGVKFYACNVASSRCAATPAIGRMAAGT